MIFWNKEVASCFSAFLRKPFLYFQATNNTKGCKRTITEKLKKHWNDDKEKVKIERKIYGYFPEISQHRGHLVNEVS